MVQHIYSCVTAGLGPNFSSILGTRVRGGFRVTEAALEPTEDDGKSDEKS